MSEENKNLLSALIKAQLDIRPPTKDKVNPRFKSKYASLDSIYQACREPLARNGLVLSHSVEYFDQKPVLVTKLLHVSGEELVNQFPLFIEQQTSQGMASARTYACRYAIASLLALPSDEDDDGEAASKEPLRQPEESITDEQEEWLHEYFDRYPYLTDHLPNILKSQGVSFVKEIKRKNFPVIAKMIKDIVAAKQ